MRTTRALDMFGCARARVVCRTRVSAREDAKRAAKICLPFAVSTQLPQAMSPQFWRRFLRRAPLSHSCSRLPAAFSTGRGIPEPTTAHEPRPPPRCRREASSPAPRAATNKLLFIMYGGRMEQQQSVRTSAPAPRRSGPACASRRAATPSGSFRSRASNVSPTCRVPSTSYSSTRDATIVKLRKEISKEANKRECELRETYKRKGFDPSAMNTV